MSIRVTFAVVFRVLAQLRRDPRTLVLIIGVPCLLEVLLHALFRGGPDLPAGRSPAARALPVHHDVPRHVDHDAARADVRNTRAADDDAACAPRPARRLRDRIRPRRRRAGDGRLAARVRAARSRGRRAACRRRCAGHRERRSRHGARSSRERLRTDGVPGGAVHAGDRPAADPAVRALRQLATRWRRGSAGSRPCCR